MKHAHWRTVIGIILGIFLTALLGSGSAEWKQEGVISGDLDGFFGWVYSTGTLTDGAQLRDHTLRISSIFPKGVPEGEASVQAEGLTGCTAEFVRGDEALRNAIRITFDRTNSINYASMTENTTVTAIITIDNSQLTTGGTATFTFTFESEHYAAQKTETLIVLSGEELPSVSGMFEDPVFFLKPGASFTTANATQMLLYSNLVEFCRTRQLPVPLYGTYIDRPQQEGLIYEDSGDLFKVTDYGVFDLTLHYFIGNMQWDIPFRVQSKPYSLRGAGWVLPGQSTRYSITDEDAAASRKYTFSVSGNDAVIDPETGLLEVSPDATVGQPLTIAITPENEPPYTMNVRVVDGQLTALDEAETAAENGFHVPVPSGNGWSVTVSESRENGWIYRGNKTGESGAQLILEARTDSMGDKFREDDLAVQAYYDSIVFNSSAADLQREDIRIDGHLARMFTYTTRGQDNQLYRAGQILYTRNNSTLTLNLYALQDGATEETLQPVTMADLKKLAAGIHYAEEEASIRQGDIKLSVASDEGVSLVSAGKTAQITAAFANPEVVNEAAGNGRILWEVTDPATGMPSEWAVINGKGVLSVRDNLENETEVKITAMSETYHTQASCMMTLIPASKKISIEPETAFYYRGTETSVPLQAVILPETVPMKGLTWSTSRPEISEIIPGKDGTAQFRFTGEPMSLQVFVKDPAGKTAAATITLVDPITEVTIAARGTAQRGRSMTFSAVTEPKRGIDSRIEWSIDAGEDVAVISADGVLTIAAGAEPGTVITVTCKALGATEPLTVQEQVVVE